MAEIVTIINLFYFARLCLPPECVGTPLHYFGVLSLRRVLRRDSAYNEGSKQINVATKLNATAGTAPALHGVDRRQTRSGRNLCIAMMTSVLSLLNIVLQSRPVASSMTSRSEIPHTQPQA